MDDNTRNNFFNQFIMKTKLSLGLFVIAVVFAFSSKQQMNAAPLNYPNQEIASLINPPTDASSTNDRQVMQGKITSYNEKGGYGTVKAETTGASYVFVKSDCTDGYKPKLNDKVSFELVLQKKGVIAVNVKASK